MKKTLLLVALFLIILSAVGCASRDPNQFPAELAGSHKIRKMFTKDMNISETNSSFNAGYFIFFGTASGKSNQSVTAILFAWEDKDGVYIVTQLPLDKVRVKIIDDWPEAPTVRFFLDDKYSYYVTRARFDENQGGIWDNYLTYAVVTVANNDWPENINLPFN